MASRIKTSLCNRHAAWWPRTALALALNLVVAAVPAMAGSINLGIFSFDSFIPSAGSLPGTNAFSVSNLTGLFALPSDFPALDSVVFHDAVINLNVVGQSQQSISLGDIGPGFLLDPGGNPLIQVSAATVYSSAEFIATLVPATFALDDGTTFTADSAAIDVVLAPSAGSSLVAGVDLVAISVEQSTGAVPEPASVYLLGAAALGLGMRFFRSRGPRRRSEN